MADSTFDLECDRLSRLADPEQFEKLEWARTSGASLLEAERLALQAFEHRKDLILASQPTDDRRKRFALSTQGSTPRDIATLWMKVEGQMLALWLEPRPGSGFRISGGGKPFTLSTKDIDENWIISALQQLISLIDRS
ncbi:MAG TPA: hypothetical protein VEX16_03760 [Methyloceanibacter sp.]|nr:hypothetical protein [Methyloceanibacter sp.]